MLALFQVLDENHSGLLPAVKFRKALGCLGLSLRDEDVQAMLVDFGVKTTDLIDYEVRQHVVKFVHTHYTQQAQAMRVSKP
jgi:Ca2+-binding EF-hand superfamily protein